MAESKPTCKQRIRFRLSRLQRRFARMSLREQLLALLVFGVVLYYWFSNHLDRQRSIWAAIELANQTASIQREAIAQEMTALADFEAEIAAINLQELPSMEQVRGLIDDLIRRYRSRYAFSYTFLPPVSERGQPLSFHTFRIDITKIQWELLRELSDELQTTLPYVSLRRLTIGSQQSNPTFLNATFELRSIEYTQ